MTDAGYISAPALESTDKNGYELTGPIDAPPHSGERFGSDSFVVDIPNRKATCPAGKISTECSRILEGWLDQLSIATPSHASIGRVLIGKPDFFSRIKSEDPNLLQWRRAVNHNMHFFSISPVSEICH